MSRTLLVWFCAGIGTLAVDEEAFAVHAVVEALHVALQGHLSLDLNTIGVIVFKKV